MDELVAQGVQATLQPLRERGLQVCQIGAFGYNPLSSDHTQREKQTTLLKQAIPLIADTGCPYIVICGGNVHPSGFGASDPHNFTPQALDEVARELQPLVALAERYGVRLSIEPYLKTAVCSAERFIDLWAKVGSDALRVNVDVTSLYGSFWEFMNPADSVQHTCELLAGYYGLAHIKEVALNEGFHLHAGLAPLGAGNTNWAQVLRLIAPHLPADSWVILEHCLSAAQVGNDLHHLRAAAARASVTLE
jgi:sugar phosphate isomerase/epimerase